MHCNRQSRRWRERPQVRLRIGSCSEQLKEEKWKESIWEQRFRFQWRLKWTDADIEKGHGNGSNMAAVWYFSIPVLVSDFLMLWCKSWHFFCILMSLECLSTAAGNKGVILGFYLDVKRRPEKPEWLQRAVSWEVIKWTLNVLDSLTHHITDGLSDSFYCLSLK